MLKLQASNGKIDLQANNGSIALQVPIQQSGGGAVNSVNGMTGDVVLEIPSIEGLASIKYVDNGLATKQDTLTAGTNITIDNGVISATGGSGGSDIKSIRLSSNTVGTDFIAEHKELLTYLWGTGSQGDVDLTKCIVTVDGILINEVYVSSPYIYFYPSVLSNFTSDGLAKYIYICNYTEAMKHTENYRLINKSQYATTLLTSDNYAQYTQGNYTTDSSDGNLYNATELYICIYNSGGYYAFVYIKVEQGMNLGNCTYRNYSYAISNTIHSLFYDGTNLIINNDSADDSIQFIWYK